MLGEADRQRAGGCQWAWVDLEVGVAMPGTRRRVVRLCSCSCPRVEGLLIEDASEGNREPRQPSVNENILDDTSAHTRRAVERRAALRVVLASPSRVQTPYSTLDADDLVS